MNPVMFSVMTLNLRFGLADDGPNSWYYRKHCLPYLFSQYRPDFIALQEANDFQIDFLNQLLAAYDFIGKRSPAPPSWQDNIIFYQKTWECNYHEHFFLSSTPHIPSRFKQSRWPRQCTIGMFTKGDRKIICVTTHLDFERSVQMDSAKLILKQLSNLPHNLPAILTGDFNATPSSSCHMIFTGQDMRHKIEGPCLKNVFEDPFPGTFHGFRGEINGDHIDWILYRGGIIPEDRKVIRKKYAGIYPSDHFPVYASFEWQT